MKRLALFLIALIVPLQFASANIVCYSHTQVKNTHFVHVDSHDADCVSHSHSHNFIEHEVGNANGDQHSAHCDACHAHLSTVVQNNYTWPVHHQESSSHTSFNHSFLTLVSPDAPYRPKWL
jgi:hypothetical protein